MRKHFLTRSTTRIGQKPSQCDKIWLPRQLSWTFNLDGIREMYEDYEETSMWPFLQSPSPGYRVSFVRAEKSSYKWGGQDEERIRALGHSVFMLRNAGHWLHTDNPSGLVDILRPTFGKT